MKQFEVHLEGFEMAHLFRMRGLDKSVFAILGQLQMNFALGALLPSDATFFVRDAKLRKYLFVHEQVAVQLLDQAKKAKIIRFHLKASRSNDERMKPTYVLQIYSVAYAGTGTALASTATNLLETITFS